ncbi:MAG TPA: hypothetical protein VKV06_05870 [Acidimicrobiales bacterium]|nr:hypothetical protein [Acidimicrobiales bacterium]
MLSLGRRAQSRAPLPRTTSDAIRAAGLVLAGVRSVLGAAALLAPGAVLKPWIGDRSGDKGALLLSRSLGGRDLAVGAGALVAAATGQPTKLWLRAGALSDATDSLGTLAAFRHLPRLWRWGVLAASLGGMTMSWLAASRASR